MQSKKRSWSEVEQSSVTAQLDAGPSKRTNLRSRHDEVGPSSLTSVVYATRPSMKIWKEQTGSNVSAHNGFMRTAF